MISLEVDNPKPSITSFTPLNVVTGTGPLTLSMAGTGFVPSTVIQVNGGSRATSVVSSTQVNVTLNAADIAVAGSLAFTAVNLAPGGGSSGGASVPVLNPVPSAIAISPSTTAAGVNSVPTFTVTGTNFVSGSAVQINGSSRPTAVLSSTQLTFQLTDRPVIRMRSFEPLICSGL